MALTKAQAFHAQACSDFAVYEHLAAQPLPECHALHYLQMAAEKVAKALILRSNPDFGESHVAFSVLPHYLARPGLGRALGWQDDRKYRSFLKAVKPLLRAVEELCPAIEAGANTEYPWAARAAGGTMAWQVPAAHDFHLLPRLRNPYYGVALHQFMRVLLDPDRFEALPLG